MEIKIVLPLDELWDKLIEYSKFSNWAAGPTLSRWMKEEKFKDYERVFVAYDNNEILGYCTITKEDCIPNVCYSPYIGFVYVDEKHRGNRISEKMIEFASMYAKSIGFSRIYLTSDHENLYEKYGFEVIDKKYAYWGNLEKIYVKNL